MDEALKLITLLIFAACYGLAISRKFKLAYIGLLSAFLVLALLLPTNALTPQQALNSVKWDVLGIYWGFMMLSIIFSDSGVPKQLARYILHRTRNEGVALLALCGLTAFLSSLLENVGVILIMAPIAIEVSRKTKSSLFLYLVAIAISSNMVTTVTMVADPPAIILASETGMSFLDFFWYQGRIGLGIISAAGAIVGLITIYLMHFRKLKKKIHIGEERIETNYIPTVVFIGGISALAINSYLGVGPGIIGFAVGVISLILGRRIITKMIKEFDWNSFFFIIGIFVVIGATEATGILGDFAGGIGRISLNNPIIGLTILIWVSVAFSSFMDNVPYTVLMIPVAKSLAVSLGMGGFAYPLLYGMILGTGIGGNITPVGATANVFACGLLEKRGHKVKLIDFMKISLIPTILSVLAAQLLLMLLWM
ncbi:MAG: SLC13 family permease [Methanobacteriota archaeon]